MVQTQAQDFRQWPPLLCEQLRITSSNKLLFRIPFHSKIKFMQRAFRGWTMRASYWFSKGWLFSRLNKSPWKLSFGTNPQPQPRIFDNGHLFFVCSWGSPAVIPQWTVLRIPFYSRIEFTQSPSQSAPTILVLKTWLGLWPWKKIQNIGCKKQRAKK